MKKQLSAILAVSLIASNFSPMINIYASELGKENIVDSTESESTQSVTATITPFTLVKNDNFEAYNEQFKIATNQIKSITNNGGKYGSSSIEKAIDGNLSTHWETGKANSSSFENEVIFEFEEIESINRLVYATRQDGAKGKGFPTQFEIYGSLSGEDEDYQLLVTGEHKSTGDLLEFKFPTITTKKLKFVFKEANQGWASASEFWFYKEDAILDQMDQIFTNDSKNEVSEAYNTLEKLEEFKNEAMNHPLYQLIEEDIKNAQLLIEMAPVEYVEAEINTFIKLTDERLSTYDDLFKVSRDQITSITTNGGHYGSNNIEKSMDGDANTNWHSGKTNSDNHTNEVIITLNELTTINRLMYTNQASRGYAQVFEIYISKTSEGDTFEKVTSGEMSVDTKNTMEISFNPTAVRRIKFVYKQGYENWALASEFGIYKQDGVLEQSRQIFTNNSKNEVSEAFNTIDKLAAFTEQATTHPLYDDMKEELENAKIILETNETVYSPAMISKFVAFTDERLTAYDELFKVSRDQITSITTNGGHYGSSNIEKAIDGDLNTNWHSGKTNSDTHTNEVVITLDELTTINRFMYTNQASRGYAQAFEIYISKTTQGDTFEKVTDGEMSVNTKNTMEILFNPTEARRIKLVYKQGYENWALASEIGIYKQDITDEMMDILFIDDSMSEVSPHFATLGALESLAEAVAEHPFKEDYLEKLEIAKELVDYGQVESGTANVSKFEPFYTDYLTNYDEMFRVNGLSIKNNGGNYASSALKYAIDEDANTHWETGNPNSETFKNEVILTLEEAQVISRLTYKARSGGKGFAKEFSIYVSPVASGDNFQKVSTGNYTVTSDMLEIQFEATKAKRVKFVFEQASQNWASISDIRLYKEDTVANQMKELFTNGLQDTVSDAFNSLEKLEVLEVQVSTHPLAPLYLQDINMAKAILNETLQSIKTVVAEQQGDRSAHASQNFKFGFGNNYQPTGIVALAGKEIVVYVDAEPGQPLPQLVFSQQEGSFASWGRTVSLHIGKNVITVPQVTQNDGWYNHSVTPGGAVYILNPYTEQQQSKAPVIRFAEGVEQFPMMDATTNEQEYLALLVDYKTRLDADALANPDVMDRQMIDVAEISSNHLVFTGTATGAYEAYINQGYSPMDTVTMYNDHMDMVFEYLGFDGSNIHNDINFTREHIRLAQPFGYMYAAGGHIGVQRDVMVSMLTSVGSWGVDHEMGHKLDIAVRTIGEVTNNMIPQFSSYYYNKPNKRIPFESHTYKNVISTNSNQFYNGGFFENLATFWQIEMVYPGYWGKVNQLYRENNIVLDSENASLDKLNQLAKYSSIALEVDLTEHFERHGFYVSDETKEFTSQYPKPDKRLWYANYDYYEYSGEGFTDEVGLAVNLLRENELTTLTFSVNSQNQEAVMGYEIFKNGELIGFTSTSQFTDKTSTLGEDANYTVIAYDKKLNQSSEVSINSLTPSLQLQQPETYLKLNETFDAESFIKALDFEGNDISSAIVIEGEVNSSVKGIYPVQYTIENQGINVTETILVHVVSHYDYLSDQAWESVTTQYGTPRRNTNLKGRVNGEIQNFEKGIGIHANGTITYDLSDSNYETFEALVGVDMTIASQTNSSISFKIIADGEILAQTPVLKHADNLAYINVPVSGVQQLIIEIKDGGNGNTSDHGVIVNPILTTNNTKPVLTVEDKLYNILEDVDLLAGVSASDVEDGDLTDNIEIISNTYEPNQVGRFEVVYQVTDSDQNTVEEKTYITVFEAYHVSKSYYGQFDNLSAYNEAFGIPIVSVSNNGGNYGSSVIKHTIDGEINTHWETGKPNSDSFKNEVIFDLGETTDISRIAYAARRDAGGKGFATQFEIYVSDETTGDDFYLVGTGQYTTSSSHVVEFELSNVSARRVKFKFVQANQGWASLSEVSFYKEDTLSDIIKYSLFTDETQTKLTEDYDTFEELEALQILVQEHPAYQLFKTSLSKAKEILLAKLPILTVEETTHVRLNEDFDFMSIVTAMDQEDGDLTSQVEIVSNTFEPGTVGRFEVTYRVSDSDGNTVEKTAYVVVYEDFIVNKSRYGQFNNLAAYNEAFNIPVVRVSNNAGHYGSSVITNAMTSDLNAHWETNTPNSETFKNEVVFDLEENADVATMTYAARRGGKGFATQFEIYVSSEAEGNDFIYAGLGSYEGSTNDVIQFALNRQDVRRVKFVFVEANQGWASIGNVSFYKQDDVATKIQTELFTDTTQTEVSEAYNTFEKLNAFKEEVKATYPAYELFETDFMKAEQMLQAKVPTLTIPKDIAVKVGDALTDVIGDYVALDQEDGNLTDSVVVSGQESINFDRPGTYNIYYKVTDSDGNTVEKIRQILVVHLEDFDYLTDYDWSSAKQSYGSTQKDKASSTNPLRLTNEDGTIATYERGIGAHSSATIVYDLTEQNYGIFSAYIGVDREMYGSVGSVVFQVFVDGKLAFDSGLMNSRDTKQYVEVSIAGAKELKLIVTDGGNGNGSDHATWADTKLHYVNENRTNNAALIELLDQVSTINKETYTATSVQVLEVAVAQAENILNATEKTQDAIDEAIEQLKLAVKNLILLGDFTTLSPLLEHATQLNKADYTTQSIERLEVAMAYATEIMNFADATQQLIDEAIGQLTTALNNLVTIAAYEGLETLYNQVQELKSYLYVTDSAQLIETLKTNLEQILTDKTLTQQEIEQMMSQVTTQIELLQLNELKVLIEKRLDETKEVTQEDIVGEDHTEVRWENYSVVRAEVEALLTNINATNEEMDIMIYTFNYMVDEIFRNY